MFEHLISYRFFCRNIFFVKLKSAILFLIFLFPFFWRAVNVSLCVCLTERQFFGALKPNSLTKWHTLDALRNGRFNFNSFVISHQFFIHRFVTRRSSNPSVKWFLFFFYFSTISQSIQKAEYADVCGFFVFYPISRTLSSALEFHFFLEIFSS